MTIKLASLKADLDREEKGDWIDYPDWPGVSFLVSSLQKPAYVTARDMMMQRFARQYKGKPVPRDVLLLCPDRRMARRILHDLPTSSRVYGLAGELLSSAEAGRHHLVLASPEASLVSGAGSGHIVDVHARTVARLLVSALTSAGRDLDRTSLVAAIGTVRDAEAQLDYASDALNGTAIVSFIETKPR